MFRPQIIFLDNLLSDIIHIRLKLEGYALGKRQLKRYNQIQNRFRVTSDQVKIDASKEALYQTHKEKFKGFIFHSLEQVIYDNRPEGLFDTREICVYDGGRLIAFSFFDIGEKSMASIISVYSPGYDKLSLGMFTMMREILLAQEMGLDFYYPGYIFDNNSAFDYKIRKENMQYLNEDTGRWNRFKRLKREDTISYKIENKLEEIHELIFREGIDLNKRYYPMNSLGYLHFDHNHFLKSPYILIGQIGLEEFAVIEYLFEQDTFVVSRAIINNTYWSMFDSEGRTEELDPEICLDQILEYEQVLCATEDAEEAVQKFLDYFYV